MNRPQLLTGLIVWLPLAAIASAQDPLVTKDLSGQSHGSFKAITEPVARFDLIEDIYIRGGVITPDGSLLVAHQWRRIDNGVNDQVVLINLESGETERVLIEDAGKRFPMRQMQLVTGDKAIALGGPGGLQIVSFDGVDEPRTLPSLDKSIVWYSFSTDGTKAIGTTEDRGVVIWDLVAGTAGFHQLEFIKTDEQFVGMPRSGTDRLLVMTMAQAEGEQGRILLFDPAQDSAPRELAKVAGNYNLLPAPDGKEAMVFRQEDPDLVAWTSFEFWNLESGELTRTNKLAPPLSSIGQALVADGKFLFLHEYMVQPVVIWDLAGNQLVASVAPEGGGCGFFAVTPDGKRMVASVGPWKQGTLAVDKLAVYDTSDIVK